MNAESKGTHVWCTAKAELLNLNFNNYLIFVHVLHLLNNIS